MTPAEELRAAAKLMRECAEAADAADWPGGPWAVDKCSENGCPCIVYQGERNPYTEPQVPRIQYVADTETPEHAAYIASMHPGVALAVADWLARFADPVYCYGPAEYDAALNIARAYLGTGEAGR